MMRHLCNFLLSVLPPSRCFACRRFLLRLCGINIHSSANFCGPSRIYGRGSLHIGAETWISPGAVIYTQVGANIHIGSRCDIGHDVEFIPGSHAIGTSLRRAGCGTVNPITVGDGSWIGARSIILGGVTIGEGSVVAAGSVVTKSVPPNCLVAGVPAKVKRQLSQ